MPAFSGMTRDLVPGTKLRVMQFLEITKRGPQTVLSSHPVKGRTADAAGRDRLGVAASQTAACEAENHMAEWKGAT